MELIMHYQNVFESLFEDNLFAGEHTACSGENYLINLTELSEQGISIIYSFEKDNTDKMSSLWKEKNGEHLTAINGTDITIKDFTAPTVEQLSTVVNSVINNIDNDNKVFLHCRGGLGRTGTFLAALYLSKTDSSVEDAVKFTRKMYSPHAIEIQSQVDALHEYKNSLVLIKNKGHFNAIEVDGPYFNNMENTFKELKGSALRTAILTEFEHQLRQVEDTDHLRSFVDEFKSSHMHSILLSQGGAIQKFFSIDTSSICKLNKIITEKEKQLEIINHRPK